MRTRLDIILGVRFFRNFSFYYPFNTNINFSFQVKHKWLIIPVNSKVNKKVINPSKQVFFILFRVLIFFLDYSTQNGGQAGDNTGKLINSTEIGNEGKMFIGGLSKSTTTESLKAYFEG